MRFIKIASYGQIDKQGRKCLCDQWKGEGDKVPIIDLRDIDKDGKQGVVLATFDLSKKYLEHFKTREEGLKRVEEIIFSEQVKGGKNNK